ncbi:ATP-binding domain-containing protein [Leptolyngbya sp. FACHB-321]|uniref:ATP-binding domain-containing protein n=1 Tax=Leptolyngbya sp. FACHB-321 TaxID=2692807 RepID=UPI0018EFA2AE|nr:ATP-binding domain-containing protein [Leptolyngbya sp. FACHB-321]
MKRQGLAFYIPSAHQPNWFPEAGKTHPNQFWWDGAVTVSRIHRAKGNEAERVCVVGFDQVAQDESSITLRSQLFVALTRAKGWACLSGIEGASPLYEEMQQVLTSGDTFTFTFKGGENDLLTFVDPLAVSQV